MNHYLSRQITTTTTCLLPLLLLLLATGTPHKVTARRIKNNEVLGCNEVMEAWRGRDGHWLGMNGSLISPNFPMPYPSRLQCRVDLKAPQQHRIRLHFTHFYLYHPLNSSHRNCEVMDSLTVSESPTSRLGTFCGVGKPLPIMSSGSFLSLVFRSLTSGPHVTGYRAIYTFLRDFGLTSGHQLLHHPCTFEFNSTLYPSGEIHSPNPGGKYPRNTVCHYVFHGRSDQRVRLDFKFLDVEGVAPCSLDSDSDFVEFSSQPGEHEYVLPRRCGRFAPKAVESEGSFLRVTFRSNHKYEGLGFAASFRFFTAKNKKTPGHMQPLSVAASGSGGVWWWRHDRWLAETVARVCGVFLLLRLL
ncbi:suppressor of lurcher protein 1-like [Scylla paramamosain]